MFLALMIVLKVSGRMGELMPKDGMGDHRMSTELIVEDQDTAVIGIAAKAQCIR